MFILLKTHYTYRKITLSSHANHRHLSTLSLCNIYRFEISILYKLRIRGSFQVVWIILARSSTTFAHREPRLQLPDHLYLRTNLFFHYTNKAGMYLVMRELHSNFMVMRNYVIVPEYKQKEIHTSWDEFYCIRLGKYPFKWIFIFFFIGWMVKS